MYDISIKILCVDFFIIQYFHYFYSLMYIEVNIDIETHWHHNLHGKVNVDRFLAIQECIDVKKTLKV